jgi:diadenosine tetraphosphate (Ap4A) HIT family hydrolase
LSDGSTDAAMPANGERSCTVDWERWAAGERCPFDAPRAANTDEWDAVATLATATLYLPTAQTYRGHCILVYDVRHATRPDQLTLDEWTRFTADLHRATTAIVDVCRPDHVNVASLGNVMPHLHWHIVPRYKTDPRWGAPIWLADAADEPRVELPSRERGELLDALRRRLR